MIMNKRISELYIESVEKVTVVKLSSKKIKYWACSIVSQ